MEIEEVTAPQEVPAPPPDAGTMLGDKEILDLLTDAAVNGKLLVPLPFGSYGINTRLLELARQFTDEVWNAEDPIGLEDVEGLEYHYNELHRIGFRRAIVALFFEPGTGDARG